MRIPKLDGGERQLGIPTVVDRLVQQAILQVMTRLLDWTFSSSSECPPGASEALGRIWLEAVASW